MRERISHWWKSRAPRERVILALAGGMLVFMLYFLVIWEPLAKGAERLEKERQHAAELSSWLQSIEPELAQLRRTSVSKPAGTSQGSVLAIVDSSAKSGGLGNAVKRMQPEGDNTVRVWLEKAPFNTMLTWLQRLEQQHAISAADLSISQENEPGFVKARLTLER